MTAWLKKALGYVIAAGVGMVLTLVLLAAILPTARTGILQGLAGVGGIGVILGGIFGAKKIKEATDAPKTKTDILAADPHDSLGRLPDDLRAHVDAGIKSDIDAQVDDIFRRHGSARPGGGGSDASAAPGGTIEG